MAQTPRTSGTQGPETGATKERRRYYRATTRLRFRILEGSLPPRVWVHWEGGKGSALYHPDPQTLEDAKALLRAVPRRTINLSEGGMRVRFPEQEPDRDLLEGGGHKRQRRVHVLLAFGELDAEGTAIFHLPAQLVRVDKLPWARFVALQFYGVPDGLRQRLEGEVMAIERRRLRRNLLAYGTTEGGEAMAERLRRMETAHGTQQKRKRQKLRRLPRQRRFFP